MPINHSVANLAALTAVPASAVRVDGYLLLVLDPSPAGSTDTIKEPPCWYVYRNSSTADVLGNLCLEPDDNPSTGRWMKTTNLVHVAIAKPVPTDPNPMKGITWIANLTSPTRTVIYESDGSSTWAVAKQQPMIYTTAPDTPAYYDIPPDFPGQLWFVQGNTDDPTDHTLYVGGTAGPGATAWIEVSSVAAALPY